MPYGSKKRRASRAAGQLSKRSKYVRPGVNRVPRSMAPGAGANSCIVPLTVDYDFALTADIAAGFEWDTSAVYITAASGNSSVTIPGATEVQAVFQLMRIHKIEVTILPAATGLDYSAQTLSTGATNIPYLYHAVDFDDSGQPTLNGIKEQKSCFTDLFDHPIRRTIYPRLEGSNGVIDIGANRRNMFKKSDVGSTQRWHGYKLYLDMKNQVWTYGIGRVSFKVFYECMSSH